MEQGDFTADHPPKESHFRTYFENRIERGITFFGVRKEWSFLNAKVFDMFGFKMAKKFPELVRLIETTDDVSLKARQHKFELEEIKQFFSQTNLSNKWNLVKASIVIVIYIGGKLISREQVAALTFAGQF